MSKVAYWLRYVTILALVFTIVETWKEARETNRFIEQILEIAKESLP